MQAVTQHPSRLTFHSSLHHHSFVFHDCIRRSKDELSDHPRLLGDLLDLILHEPHSVLELGVLVLQLLEEADKSLYLLHIEHLFDYYLF